MYQDEVKLQSYRQTQSIEMNTGVGLDPEQELQDYSELCTQPEFSQWTSEPGSGCPAQAIEFGIKQLNSRSVPLLKIQCLGRKVEDSGVGTSEEMTCEDNDGLCKLETIRRELEELMVKKQQLEKKGKCSKLRVNAGQQDEGPSLHKTETPHGGIYILPPPQQDRTAETRVKTRPVAETPTGPVVPVTCEDNDGLWELETIRRELEELMVQKQQLEKKGKCSKLRVNAGQQDEGPSLHKTETPHGGIYILPPPQQDRTAETRVKTRPVAETPTGPVVPVTCEDNDGLCKLETIRRELEELMVQKQQLEKKGKCSKLRVNAGQQDEGPSLHKTETPHGGIYILPPPQQDRTAETRVKTRPVAETPTGPVVPVTCEDNDGLCKLETIRRELEELMVQKQQLEKKGKCSKLRVNAGQQDEGPSLHKTETPHGGIYILPPPQQDRTAETRVKTRPVAETPTGPVVPVTCEDNDGLWELETIRRELEELMVQKQQLEKKGKCSKLRVNAGQQDEGPSLHKTVTPRWGIYILPPPQQDRTTETRVKTRPVAETPTGPVVPVDSLGLTPGVTKCPYCEEVVLTETKSKVGKATWMTCCLCTLAGCVAGCCLIPFFMRRAKNIHHQCPLCQKNIHIRHPF